MSRLRRAPRRALGGAVRRPGVLLLGLALATLTMGGCGDDTSGDPAQESGWSVPQDGFCQEVVTQAGVSPDDVEERVDGDADDTTATCTLTTAQARVDLVVRVAEQARTQFEQTLGELEDGFTGFADAVEGEPAGTWSRGVRYEAVQDDSVRLTDLVLDGDLVVRLQLVGTPGAGDVTARQATARDTAGVLTAAVVSTLREE